MAQSQKERTLYYRRITWAEGSLSLESLLKQCHEQRDTTEKRTFPYGEGEIQGLRWSLGANGGILIHIAEYVPHQHASVVPFPAQVKHEATFAYPPPEEKHFLNGDIFCFLKENDLLLCPSGAHEAVAESYIKHVLRACGKKDLLSKLDVSPVADLDKVKYLKQHGVKKLELDASLYEATVDYEERQNVRETLMKDISDSFMALFMDDPKEELRGITDKENLKVKLIISYDKRGSGEIGHERLMQASKKLIHASSDEGGFRIVAGDGQTFTHNQIRISEKCKLAVVGSSVDRSGAWQALQDYYERLTQTGVIHQ